MSRKFKFKNSLRDGALLGIPVLTIPLVDGWWRILCWIVFWVCLGVRDALKAKAEASAFAEYYVKNYKDQQRRNRRNPAQKRGRA